MRYPLFTYVIGLEIHIQLKTRSKMFCRCSNDGENQPLNTTICPICLGHPGTLPVMNKQAIKWGMRTALALHCSIPPHSKFDRKNYFYPDLPKGYQISQYDQPIGKSGYLDIQMYGATEGQRPEAHIRINRLHLEEDAAKLVHSPGANASLVDFNRSSTPLMEIVTEPDITSPLEAKTFLQELRLLARSLNVSSADMEKGHLRCDANVSLKFEHAGVAVWTPISEIKNLNSFKAVEKALTYEAQRLYDEWVAGGEVTRRAHKITVGWDDTKECTMLQRSKEEAHDYRYFPEPDLPPLHFSEEEVEIVKKSLPELPIAKRKRLIDQYGITHADATLLVESEGYASFFEKSASELDEWLCSLEACDDAFKTKTYKLLANWFINKLPPALNAYSIALEECKVTPENFGELIALIQDQKINSSAAQVVLEEMVETGAEPKHIMQEKNLEQVSDTSSIESACDTVLAANADAVSNYKAGKTTAIMFLVGQVMKEMKGKAQPEMVKTILEKKLS
ncbi:Asp-tRNA(Asn)/Glu-tRNA(Gln) amidotransferase subunit GatB [Candidatus Uhrbacteria bacterium]|nr:Asp-tRNA(Asn)/Glu-tRNA(Gln) amidotransferase subunit GatB [Candidatus Uhrbacteria bacterium]